jgi:3'(2'), 5'-bisphosphate nucleotidase
MEEFDRENLAAVEIAARAGDLLLRLRLGLADGADPDVVRAAGDRRSNDLILRELRRRFPADAVLSEESADDPRRHASRRVWIVDPLDGTREFGEPDRSDWAVHVALAVDGLLVAAAVALPAQGRTFAMRPPSPIPPAADIRPRIAVSRTRPAAEAGLLAQRMNGELVPMGSAGAKAMAILGGQIDIYVHSGGQHVWDSGAPAGVALGAGLHASRIDGSPLDYGQRDTWLPDLLICRPELAEAVISALATRDQP